MLKNFINEILDKIKNNNQFNNDLEHVNKYMELLISELYCYSKIKYLINNKGKRLRSLLALYYYDKYKSNNNHNIDILYKILAIIELTHFASLLHDDVIDNNKFRRQEKSFNYIYGNRNTILVGDYLLMKIFNNLLQILNNKEYNKYIINQFIKANIDTVYGVSLENNLAFNNIFNKNYHDIISINQQNILNTNTNNKQYNNYIKNYIKIARLKTGSLFKFSCITGSILSNTDFNKVKQSASFGILFGIIYQIQDDIDDYNCNNYKDSEDYMQSNITFPIILLQSIYRIEEIFYNKNQENFYKIKTLINTNDFKNMLNNAIKSYINLLKELSNKIMFHYNIYFISSLIV